jgi:hypothetical protein
VFQDHGFRPLNLFHGGESSASAKLKCQLQDYVYVLAPDDNDDDDVADVENQTNNMTRLLLPGTGPDATIIESLQDEMPPEEFDRLEETCNMTCQAEVLLPDCRRNNDKSNGNDKDNNNHYWELQAMDVHGNPKAIGGDEFYVTFTDHAVVALYSSQQQQQQQQYHPTAVAEITDLQNGRYRLNFTESPLNHRQGRRLLGRGVLTVALQYTCGIGNMYPPTKNHWPSGGHMVVREWQTNKTTLLPSPPIHPFQPPFLSSSLQTLFQKNKHIVPFGDSVMQQFVQPLNLRLKNNGMCLNTSTVPKWTSKLDDRHKIDLQQPDTVLLVSSAAWDILEKDNVAGLEDHRQAMRIFFRHVRSKYPKVSIVWKGPTAVHIQVPMLLVLAGDVDAIRAFRRRYGPKSFLDRMRYMSASRSWDLHQAQQQVCRDEGLFFLDVYQASYLSADHTYIGDGRHYEENLNTMMVHWFVTQTSVERQWQLYINSLSKKRQVSVVAIDVDGDEECGLHDDSEYWTGLVNAAIVAMVTNQRLEIRILNRKQDECAGSNMFHPRFQSQSDAARSATSNSTMNRSKASPTMRRLVKEGSANKVPLTLDGLEQEGHVKPSSLSQQVANQLFAKGSTFLYGMILKDLLRWPVVVEDSSRPSTLLEVNYFDVSKNVVLSVHGNEFDGRELKSCLDYLVANVTRPLRDLADEPLDCRVLFPSQYLAGQWKDILEREYNCSAIVVPNIPGQTSSSSSLATYARVVADASHDGIVTSPSSEMFASLVHYMRFENARNRGRLPIDDDWALECTLNGNAPWSFR